MARRSASDSRGRKRSPETLRLFVAAYPPALVVDHLLQEVARIELPPHRPLPVDQVHLTTWFIGETDRRDIPRVEESVERAAVAIAPIVVAPDRIVTLPARGAARLVGATAPCPSPLQELHQRLRSRLARSERVGKPFLPHLTLLRFSPPQRGLKVQRELQGIEFEITSLRLVRSELLAAGARHHTVSEIPLATRR